MEIEIIKIDQMDDVLKRVFKHIWGVDSKMNRKKLFASNDSILEIPEYVAICNVPRSVALHIETHKKKHRSYMWLGTARPDRADRVKGEYSREQLIPMTILFTPRWIKEVSHYRMCTKAEAPTREFMKLFKEELAKVEPALAEQMMPMCEFRNGLCTEFGSCGKYKKEAKDENI